MQPGVADRCLVFLAFAFIIFVESFYGRMPLEPA